MVLTNSLHHAFCSLTYLLIKQLQMQDCISTQHHQSEGTHHVILKDPPGDDDNIGTDKNSWNGDDGDICCYGLMMLYLLL